MRAEGIAGLYVRMTTQYQPHRPGDQVSIRSFSTRRICGSGDRNRDLPEQVDRQSVSNGKPESFAEPERSVWRYARYRRVCERAAEL